MNQKELKSAREGWQRLCLTVQKCTVAADETPAVKIARIERLRSNYAEFVKYYFQKFDK